MKQGIRINKTLRYGYGILLGLAFNFNLDIVFSLLYSNYKLLRPPSQYLAAILLSYFIFESLFILNRWLNKSFDWDKNLFKRLFFQILLDSSFAIIFTLGFRWLWRYYQEDFSYISIQDIFAQGFFVFIIILIYCLGEMTLFLLNKWRLNLAELERFKKENAEYRFELLQSQLNPHFFFNSLNTLSALVYKNQENASNFIRKLSDVYRYILDHRDQELVALETEIIFAKSFIVLMQLRFENHLHFNMKPMESIEKYQVAPLTLQLLIENAIKHNIVSKKKPLQIDIFTEEDFLVVKNQLQEKNTNEDGYKMGLKNIQSRYAFLTDKKVEIFNDGIFFKVKIPLMRAKN